MLAIRSAGTVCVAALGIFAATPASTAASGASGTWYSLGPSAPPAVQYAGAVYDPVRQRMIVLPNASGDVWSIPLVGPSRWTLEKSPVATTGHAQGVAVYDAVRDRVVLFGGWSTGPNSYGTTPSDVWELGLDGAPLWQPVLSPGTAPPVVAYSFDGGALDAARDRILYVRGGDEVTYGFDVWALPLDEGSSWTKIVPSGPGPFAAARASYDAAGDRLVVTGTYPGYAWELGLGGAPAWTRIDPLAPITLDHQASYPAAFDVERQRTLTLQGGKLWEVKGAPVAGWTLLGATPSVWNDGAIVHDPVNDQVVLFPGGSASLARNRYWTMALDPPGAWVEHVTVPDSRSGHTAVWDRSGDRMIVYGGANVAPGNEVWQLAGGGLAVDAERIVTSGPAPPARSDHAAVYDPVRGRMLVFGGLGGLALDDTWELTLGATPAWNELAPAGAKPAGRSGHSMIYDPVRDRMIVFGGVSVGRLNDVWALSLGGTPAWTQLAPTGTAPSARYGHRAIYDPVRDRMIVFGGYAGSAELNDVWSLDLASLAWSKLTPGGTLPAGRRLASAVYDPLGDRMIVCGGRSSASTLSDVQALSFAPLAWTELSPGGISTGNRWGHTAVYDPARDRMVVVGGTGGVGDLIQLSWVRSQSVGVPEGGARVPLALRFSPNPARGGLVAEFDLPDARPATLELFDLAGRRVAGESVGSLGAGRHRLACGARLPAGIYLARLTRAGLVVTARGAIVE